jgi:hypothetical protein
MWREFKATALTKAFIIAAVAVPMMMIGLGVLGPFLFNPKPPPLGGTIAIVDPSGDVARAAKVEFDPQKIRERIRATAKERSEAPSGLTEQASAGDMTGMSRNPRSASAVTREFDINLTLDDQHQPSEIPDLKAKLAAGELVAIITTVEPPTPQAVTQADASATQPAEPPSSPATAPATTLTAYLYIPSQMNVKHTGLIEDLVQAACGRARIVAADDSRPGSRA